MYNTRVLKIKNNLFTISVNNMEQLFWFFLFCIYSLQLFCFFSRPIGNAALTPIAFKGGTHGVLRLCRGFWSFDTYIRDESLRHGAGEWKICSRKASVAPLFTLDHDESKIYDFCTPVSLTNSNAWSFRDENLEYSPERFSCFFLLSTQESNE